MSRKSRRNRERRRSEGLAGETPAAAPSRPDSRAGKPSRVLVAAVIAVTVIIIGAAVLVWRRGNSAGTVPALSPAPATFPATTNQLGATNQAAPRERIAALLEQANQLLGQGKTEQAIALYRQAAELAPGDEDAHYNLGIALARLGQTNEAIAEYEAALQLFPDFVEAHNNLGNLLLRAGRTDEAIRHFRAAIQALPDYARAHNNLGNALRMAGQVEEAGREFAKAVELDTNYWEARFNLGNICETRNLLSEAASHYREVLRLKPGFVLAEQALAAVERKLAEQAR